MVKSCQDVGPRAAPAWDRQARTELVARLSVEPVASAFGAPLGQPMAGTAGGRLKRLEEVATIDTEVVEPRGVELEKCLERQTAGTSLLGFGNHVRQSLPQ